MRMRRSEDGRFESSVMLMSLSWPGGERELPVVVLVLGLSVQPAVTAVTTSNTATVCWYFGSKTDCDFPCTDTGLDCT